VTVDEHTQADRLDLVVGADGLDSIVRRLVFGPEDQLRRFLGVSYGLYGWPPQVE
jgi:2-polyprenyl-6-methoxyphenol hydroxylase-like FAD-dependent oxidoreductase